MGEKPQAQASIKTPLPENWPSHIPYLTRSAYSPFLSPAHLRALHTRPADASDPLPEIPRQLKTGPCPSVRIIPITDPNHPAYGQAGLFATRDLAPGELILPYFGEVHIGTPPFGRLSSADSSSRRGGGDDGKDDTDDGYDYAQSDYDLWLDRDADLAVDAARMGNEARFVNDYRGVPDRGGNFITNNCKEQKKEKNKLKKRPNAEFRAAWDPRTGERCMAVFVLPAGKRATGRARTVGIARGEEILVSYGKGFWQERRGMDGGEDGGGDAD
ncbi:hypothetical protein VTH82DRAFT_8682 [Thermothelomyces myriococcoides]